MDKQIIIDGCDVSGCEYYFDEKCRCMDASIMQDFYLCPQCNNNPNCYYKNWQRTEQKLEKIKKVCNKFIPDHFKILLIINNGVVEEQENELDQLKASLEEKNKFLEQLGISASGEFHRIKYYVDKLVAENEKLKNERKILDDEILVVEITEQQFEEYQKLKQTLDEIKEIARVNSINTCWTVLNICNECEEQNKCEDQSPFTKLKQILQKISECEVNNER